MKEDASTFVNSSGDRDPLVSAEMHGELRAAEEYIFGNRLLLDLADFPLAAWQKKVLGPLQGVLGIHELNRGYRQLLIHSLESGESFFASALHELGASYRLSEEDRAKIPQAGPLIVMANHPFGCLDGVILGDILRGVRPDMRLMANFILGSIPEFRPYLIGVDPFGGGGALSRNRHPLRASIDHLRQGGCLGMFPAGEVSHCTGKRWEVQDPEWNHRLMRLVQRTQATVLPVYFGGRNSVLFNALGLLHPRLRTLLLVRELCKKRDATIDVRVGSPLSAKKLASVGDDKQQMDYLRLKTYLLRARQQEETAATALRPTSLRQATQRWGQLMRNRKDGEVIADAISPELLQEEVAALPADCLLHRRGHLVVYVAKAPQMGKLLPEIGRLRELTFRDVGEGTGKSCDLDRFDAYYQHVFLWDEHARAIVGAYRMGLTDQILRQHGRTGLYTHTLFHYKPEVFDTLGEGMELGRSFIVPAYQRKHATLSILWRGIGEFVVRHPQYKKLYGPVSIAADYNKISRNLMVQFLKSQKFHGTLARLVKARTPLRAFSGLRSQEKKAISGSLFSIEAISALVSEIETDNKGIPTMLKHYLKLNGQLLSFNVDRQFSNVLDGLILVDFTQTDQALLKRILGDEGLVSFNAYHAQKRFS